MAEAGSAAGLHSPTPSRDTISKSFTYAPWTIVETSGPSVGSKLVTLTNTIVTVTRNSSATGDIYTISCSLNITSDNFYSPNSLTLHFGVKTSDAGDYETKAGFNVQCGDSNRYWISDQPLPAQYFANANAGIVYLDASSGWLHC